MLAYMKLERNYLFCTEFFRRNMEASQYTDNIPYCITFYFLEEAQNYRFDLYHTLIISCYPLPHRYRLGTDLLH